MQSKTPTKCLFSFDFLNFHLTVTIFQSKNIHQHKYWYATNGTPFIILFISFYFNYIFLYNPKLFEIGDRKYESSKVEIKAQNHLRIHPNGRELVYPLRITADDRFFKFLSAEFQIK